MEPDIPEIPLFLRGTIPPMAPAFLTIGAFGLGSANRRCGWLSGSKRSPKFDMSPKFRDLDGATCTKYLTPNMCIPANVQKRDAVQCPLLCNY